MVQYNKDCRAYFRTVNGKSITFLLSIKGHGVLSLSLRSEQRVLSLKNTLSWGFFVCALVLSGLTLGLVYVLALVLTLLVFVVCKMFCSTQEETLLIVKGLGYQVSRKSAFKETSSFIPYEKMQRIFISEVILRHRVIYVITLLVREDAQCHKLIPLFKDTLPKLDCLEVIYKNIKCFIDS